MIVINREINDTLILRTKQEEEKKRKPVYYLITRNRMIRHIQYSTSFYCFLLLFFVVSSFERSLIRFL